MSGPSKNEQKTEPQKRPRAPQTPRRLRPSIRFDPIHPQDYLKYDLRISCEDCTHFNRETEVCSLGYDFQWHRKDFQKKTYELNGKVAFCSFIEID